MKTLMVSRHPLRSKHFRRIVRDNAGNAVRELVFNRGEVHAMRGEDLRAVHGDIGKALVVVKERKGDEGYEIDFAKTEQISGCDVRSEFERQRIGPMPDPETPAKSPRWIGRASNSMRRTF